MISLKFEGKINMAVFAMLLCNAALGGWYANMIYTKIMSVEKSSISNTAAISNLQIGLANLAGKIDALLEQEHASAE